MTMPRPRRRGRLPALLLGAAIACLLLVAAELVGRWHENLVFPTDQPGRGYHTVPYMYGTNRHGFLERDLPVGGAASLRRVAVVGDSITYGTGTVEQTYTRRAEVELRHPWQVLNFSQYGYDAAQAAATLRHQVWSYQPDMVVYAAYTNDVVPTRLVLVGDPPRPESVDATRVIFPRWFRERSSLLRRVEGAVLARTVTAVPDFDFFRAAVVDMRDQASDHEAEFLVFQLVPHVAAGLDRGGCAAPCQEALTIARRQEQILEELGVRHASALPYLRASGEQSFYPDNAEDWEHPSPRGHEVLGRAFADVVARAGGKSPLPSMDDPRP